jgi:CBS-domain-containing membrane protein
LPNQEPSALKTSLGMMVAGAAGGAVAIALMEELSTRATFPLIFVPFATSIVLIMGSPETAAAQPRALIGGHLLATLVGLLVVKITGPGPLAAALAVGLAMVAMHLTRSFHPPAGIDPLVIVVNDMSWSFLLAPWRSASACSPPWLTSGTISFAGTRGPSGGGEAPERRYHSAAGSRAASRMR